MNFAQKEAWNALKIAVDKFSQSTGLEVAVATTYFPTAGLNDNHLSYGDIKPQTIVYGHGNLSSEVKKCLVSEIKSPTLPPVKSQGPGDCCFGHEPKSRFAPYSSSYKTLVLDNIPEHTKPSKLEQAGNEEMQGRGAFPMPSQSKSKSGRKRSNKKRTSQGDLELDENLLFGEEDEADSSGSRTSEDTDDSEEGSIGQLPRRPYPTRTFDSSRVQYATSLPVNISLGWGHQNESASRFRDNQGPRPPTFNQPISAVPPGVRVNHAEPTPEMETMMASIQALARSVTDDTAQIFGERPRPPLPNETDSRKLR